MTVDEALVRLSCCTLIDDLSEIWQTQWPKWREIFGPLDLRRIIAKKDEVKLRLAREVIRRNTGDADIKAVLLTTIRAILTDSPSLPPAWEELSKSGWTDLDVTSIEEALFLYALELIGTVDPNSLIKTWEGYGPWWKRRMPVAAYKIVQDRLHERLKPLSQQAFKEARYGRI